MSSALRSSKIASKKKLEEPARASLNKTEARKSPGKKKNAQAGLDKESRELIKTLESKVEELRKLQYNEINRLEAMMEKESQENKHFI